MATCKNFHMEVEDSEFRCPLCFDIFEVPKSFPNCAHNLCKACLLRLVTAKKGATDIECPICRQTSPLPSQDVDGFPTNTLIVRLMEKIPGMKEKREITQAVARCKDEIERNNRIHENMQKQLGVANKNKQLAEDLKKQIGCHAREYVEAIRKCEEKMCKDVDEFMKQNCGIKFQWQLEKEIKKMAGYLEVAQNCVFNVEETINEEDLTEILGIKEVIQFQLNEYSKYPDSSVLQEAGDVKTFDMEFEKSEIKDDVLGKVFSNKLSKEMTTRYLPASASGNSCLAEQYANDLAMRSVSDSTSCSSTPLSTAQSTSSEESEDHEDLNIDWSRLDQEVTQATADIFRLMSIRLPFCPTKIAVCPISGEVALLWKEERKIYMYHPHGNLHGVIPVPYGDLSDVGFSLGNVVVVNRNNNRLLFYDKDGSYLNRQFEIARSQLKYTYLSVDKDGRLIVVSSRTDDDVDTNEEIVKCVVVYLPNEEKFSKMFGRRQLENPVSRAVFYREKFYIVDQIRSTNEIVVKTFTSQCKAAQSIPVDVGTPQLMPFVSLYEDQDEDQLIMVLPWDHSFFGILNESYRCLGINLRNQKQQEIIQHSLVYTDGICSEVDRICVEVHFDKPYLCLVQYQVDVGKPQLMPFVSL